MLCENAADGGASDLQSAVDFGFGHAITVWFPDLSSLKSGGHGRAEPFAVLPGGMLPQGAILHGGGSVGHWWTPGYTAQLATFSSFCVAGQKLYPILPSGNPVSSGHLGHLFCLAAADPFRPGRIHHITRPREWR